MNLRRNQRLLSRTSGFILIGYSAIKEFFFKTFSYRQFIQKTIKQIEDVQKEDFLQHYQKIKDKLPKIETTKNEKLFEIQKQFLKNSETVQFRQQLETYHIFRDKF